LIYLFINGKYVLYFTAKATIVIVNTNNAATLNPPFTFVVLYLALNPLEDLIINPAKSNVTNEIINMDELIINSGIWILRNTR